MDTASPLYSQFKDCAPMSGADQPLACPEQWHFRLQKSMQDHFTQIFKVVLERGYGINTSSKTPDATVANGNLNPHLGQLFVTIRPVPEIKDRFNVFAKHMSQYAPDGVAASDLRGDYILRFRGMDLHEVMPDLLRQTGLNRDEQITRHVNAIGHMLGRAGHTSKLH